MAGQKKDKQYYIDKYGAEAQAAWEKSDAATKATGGRISDWAVALGEQRGIKPPSASSTVARVNRNTGVDPYASL